MTLKNKKLNGEMKFYKWKEILIPLVGCFLIVFTTIVACIRVNEIAVETCTDVLENTTQQLARDVHIYFEKADRNMEIVEKMLSEHGPLDNQTVRAHIDSLREGKFISHYSVLLPNGENIYDESTDRAVHAKNDFLYEDWENEKVTLSKKILLNNGEYAVALTRPIIKNGKNLGVLFGYVLLNDLPKILSNSAYDGKSELYLVDARNGDLLMDTWHAELGNMYDEHLLKRPTKGKTTFAQMKKDVEDEKSGFVIFESRTTGEIFYSAYAPVGAYKLSYQLTVPDTVVFEKAFEANKVLVALTFIQLLIVGGYIVFVFRKFDLIRKKNEKALMRAETVNDIQRALFDAYKQPTLFNDALGIVSQVVRCDRCVFVELNKEFITEVYSWPKFTENEVEYLRSLFVKEDHQRVVDELKTGRSIKYSHEMLMRLNKREWLDAIGGKAVRNVVISPVIDSNNELVGFFGAVNSSDLNTAANVLEQISGIFLVALYNHKAYCEVRDMGEFDGLTGLKNRNAFNRDVELLAIESKAAGHAVSCIYIDANGLHEINNKFGHKFGDRMLYVVGEKVASVFGKDFSYRIGGDEFFVFTNNTNSNDLTEKVNQMKRELLVSDYHISAGIASADEAGSVADLIKISEERMYEDKERYYRSEGRDRRSQKVNEKVQQLLCDKRDQDVFLETIQNHYMGVYLVNLDTDQTRTIFKPEYFDPILEEFNYVYSQSLKEYARRFIIPEDKKAVEKLLNYELIRANMVRGREMKITYRKIDGKRVNLKIIPVSDYSNAKKETIWLFQGATAKA